MLGTTVLRSLPHLLELLDVTTDDDVLRLLWLPGERAQTRAGGREIQGVVSLEP